MKKFIALFLFLACIYSASAQEFMGYNYSNYQGATGMLFNPASIAGSRFKTNVNILSFNVGVANNAYTIRKKSLFSNYDNWSEGHDFSKKNSSGTKDINLNLDIVGPSFMIDLGDKIGSFGLSTRVRFLMDEKNLSNDIFQLFGNSNHDFFGKRYSQQDLRLDVHVFADIGLTYARTVWQTNNHVVKGGITAKYVMGGGGGSVRINNLQVELTEEPLTEEGINEDMIKTLKGDLTIVYSDGIDELINGDDYFTNIIGGDSKGTLAFDFGVEYEWYKDGKKKANIDIFNPWSITPYTLKASLSITDIGRVKYNASEFARSYTINELAGYPVSDLNFDGTFSEYLEELENKGILTPKDDVSTYKMSLPTVLRANVDYNAYKMLYVNAGMSLNVTGKGKYAAHHANYFYLTPRFEHKWVSVYSPFSLSSHGTAHWGLGFNFGAFFIGSGSILSNLFSSNIKGADIHFGFTVPIFKKPKIDFSVLDNVDMSINL